MEITKDFLKGEQRLGFYISPRMKSAWAAELMILSEISALCERYGITYYAEVGTLLGTVRHQGFIPWDDDIDLAMKREDYMKFLSVAHELPSDFRTRSIYDSTDTYYEFHAVVENFNGDALVWDEKRNEKYFGCPFICGVDIFPLDYIPRDKNVRALQKALYNLAYVLARSYDEDREKESYLMGLADLAAKCGGSFSEELPLKPQIYQLADRIAAMISEADADQLDYYPKMVIGGEGSVREKKWYDGSFTLPFEDIEISVPIGADEALHRHYGSYGTFVQGGAAHDYPFYKKQEEMFCLQGFMEKEPDIKDAGNMTDIEKNGRKTPDPEEKGRKRIFYYTDVLPILEYGEEILQKIRYNLSVFYEHREQVTLVWHPYEKMEEYLRKNHSPYMDEFMEMVASYRFEGWGEYSDDADYADLLAGCDAYYGDVCVAEGLAWGYGMPILILDKDMVGEK